MAAEPSIALAVMNILKRISTDVGSSNTEIRTQTTITTLRRDYPVTSTANFTSTQTVSKAAAAITKQTEPSIVESLALELPATPQPSQFSVAPSKESPTEQPLRGLAVIGVIVAIFSFLSVSLVIYLLRHRQKRSSCKYSYYRRQCRPIQPRKRREVERRERVAIPESLLEKGLSLKQKLHRTLPAPPPVFVRLRTQRFSNIYQFNNKFTVPSTPNTLWPAGVPADKDSHEGTASAATRPNHGPSVDEWASFTSLLDLFDGAHDQPAGSKPNTETVWWSKEIKFREGICSAADHTRRSARPGTMASDMYSSTISNQRGTYIKLPA